jgi:enterochelin esterase-like enzyme
MFLTAAIMTGVTCLAQTGQPALFSMQDDGQWQKAGTNEASFINRQKELQDLLVKSDIEAKFYESNGTMHEFQTWRRCMHEFAPLLFRD